MDSRLEPLFRTTFRQAEGTDARLGIRHDEEKDDGKRKKGKDDDGSDSMFGEDSAAVSVGALETFLKDLLQSAESKLETPNEEEKPQISLEAQFRPSHSPPSPDAAKAIQTYQATAKAVHDTNVASSQTPSAAKGPAISSEDAPELSAEEIRIMHELIADIAVLKEKNIQTLSIKKADTFLESLVNAVNEVKS